MMRRFILTVLVAAIAGCQNPPAQKEAIVEAPKVDPVKSDLLKTAYQNSPADVECGENLHKLEGLLMMYAAIRGELPPSLDKLIPLNGGKELTASCPVSKKPYVYVAAGLVAEGDPRMVVLYDAEASHDGKRRAMVLMPGKDGQAPYLDVVMITDAVLKAFHPAGGAKP